MTDLETLRSLNQSLPFTQKMPVLFLGHGSPMNAIEENEFVACFRKLGEEVIKPKIILCISAHWETKGTKVTAMQNPPTIHDFGGILNSHLKLLASLRKRHHILRLLNAFLGSLCLGTSIMESSFSC